MSSASRRGSATTAFKRTLAELEVGDEVEVEEPKGSFLLPEDTSVDYVFIAGGIGITVFRSTPRYIADEGLPYRVTLVYSNRDRESAAFLDELEELERRIDGLRLVLTMTEQGRLGGGDAPARRRCSRRQPLGGLEDRQFLVAGPAPMAKGVSESLLGAGVPEDSVLADKFSGY